MTKKEAIKVLKGMKHALKERDFKSEHEALDIAIKALSTEIILQVKQTDTLIIANALRYLIEDTERHELDRARAEKLREQYLSYGAKMKGGDTE